MAVSRLSISVPADVEESIRMLAERAGLPVSAWLAQLVQKEAAEQAAIVDGLRAVAEFEAENGPIPPEMMAEARQFLIETGIVLDTGIADIDKLAS